MRRFPIIFLFVSLVGLTACGNSQTWREKMTLHITTPDGSITASSVAEITITRDRWGEFLTGNMPFTREVSAEAVVADLGEGKYLFALLDDPHTRMYYALDRANLLPRATGLVEAVPWIKEQITPFELTGKSVPMLISFEDINDPASVLEVDPSDL
ncbi:MAG: hypothetical protein AAF826_10245, partial [Pseudomonadota bacterium]